LRKFTKSIQGVDVGAFAIPGNGSNIQNNLINSLSSWLRKITVIQMQSHCVTLESSKALVIREQEEEEKHLVEIMDTNQ
jgi:hypothetical protein